MLRSTLLPLAALVAALPSLAAADTSPQSMRACAQLADDAGRLACFDKIVEGLPAEPVPPASNAATGKWRVDIETNPMDDSKTVALFLIADEGRSDYDKPITLILRCQSNETSAFISWGDYLGSEAFVTSRVGEADSKRRQWSLSTNSQATFYPGTAPAFIKELMGAGRFVAQVTPYSDSPTTAVFDTSGLAEAVKPLRETCGW